MKNKETIIDSIDVSECMLYKGYCRIAALCDYSGHLCEVTSNCYFKQLARAKEEIKKLKVQIENEKQALQIDIDNLNQACLDLNQENDDLQNKLQAKEQECEELHNRTASIIYRLTGGRLSYSTYTLEGCEDAYTDQLRIDVERATKELSEENGELKAENFAFEGLVKTQDYLIDDYAQALGEIERFFDKRCDICREQNGIEVSCDFCWKKDVKDIINNANTAPTTILDKIKSFSSDDFSKFIHSLIKCSENLTCDDCYIASLPFQRRICDTKETLSNIQNWLNEEFKEQ